jgi:ATP-binding cassette subfamily B protein
MVEISSIEHMVEGRPSAGLALKEEFRDAAHTRERNSDVRPLVRLLPYVRAHWTDAFFSVFFLLTATGSLLFLTAAARFLVDRGFELHSLDGLTKSFLVVSVVVVVLALSSGFRIYFANKLGERVVVDLRRAVFDHVLTLDAAHFMKVRMGEVLSRMTTDMTIIESVMGTSVHVMLRGSLGLISALFLLLLLKPGFAALVMVLLPICLTPLFLYGRRVRRLSRLAQDRFAQTMGHAGESLDALETVQAFGREDDSSQRFEVAIEASFDASRRRIRAKAAMTSMLILLMFSGVLVILYQSAIDVFVRRTLSGGTLLQLVMLSMLAASSVRELGEVWGDMQRASGALDRIGQLLDARAAVGPPPQAVALPESRGEIAFDNVTFAYPGRKEAAALSGFSLKVRPGERIALVGPSGAGKSTVFRLLLRFYDPDQGVVRIDGADLTSADPREVRTRISLVAQDASLFSTSASENIGFGRKGATEEQIRAAAAAAQAEGFLSKLPMGFDTPVGERGKTLSGGQRQRIAIARALVRDAPILLLDEATSALDAENERLVQEALHVAMEGRTTLVIAHRLSTVLEADRIVVMDHGRVVEEGRHAELLAKGGFYTRVAKLQFGADAS